MIIFYHKRIQAKNRPYCPMTQRSPKKLRKKLLRAKTIFFEGCYFAVLIVRFFIQLNRLIFTTATKHLRI